MSFQFASLGELVARLVEVAGLRQNKRLFEPTFGACCSKGSLSGNGQNNKFTLELQISLPRPLSSTCCTTGGHVSAPHGERVCV